MASFSQDATEILTVLIGGSLLALLVGHAAGASSLISSGLGGFNTLLTTLENPAAPTATSLASAIIPSSPVVAPIFGGLNTAFAGSGFDPGFAQYSPSYGSLAAYNASVL